MLEPSISAGIKFGGLTSIDLAFGTISKFNKPYLTLVRWPLALGLLHTLGFILGSWLPGSVFGSIVGERWLSGFGAVLVFWLVLDQIEEASTGKPLQFGPKAAGVRIGLTEHNAIFIFMAVALSLDSIFAGLANPDSSLDAWSTGGVLGVTVWFCAIISTLAAFTVRKLQPKAGVKLAKFNVFGNYCSTSAIGSFGVMAADRSISGSEPSMIFAIACSASFIGFVYWLGWEMIWETELRGEAA